MRIIQVVVLASLSLAASANWQCTFIGGSGQKYVSKSQFQPQAYEDAVTSCYRSGEQLCQFINCKTLHGLDDDFPFGWGGSILDL